MTTPEPEHNQPLPYINIEVLQNGFVYERIYYSDINALTLVLRQKYQKAHPQIGVTDPEVKPNLDPGERTPGHPGMA